MASVTGETGETHEELELSYEDEQIQMLIQKHLDQEKAEVERERKRKEANAHREFIRKQDEEYQASLMEDMALRQEQEKKETGKHVPVFDEPSVEEMRRVRLLRFQRVQ
jgi:hypothetical protein